MLRSEKKKPRRLAPSPWLPAIAAWCLLLGHAAAALPTLSPEYTALSRLGNAIRNYVNEHQVLPMDWKQLDGYFDVQVESKFLPRRLDETYGFVPGSVMLDGAVPSRILLVRLIPTAVEDESEPGRYVVAGEGEFFQPEFRVEDDIQRIFQKANVALPVPSAGLPKMDGTPRMNYIPVASFGMIFLIGAVLVFLWVRKE